MLRVLIALMLAGAAGCATTGNDWSRFDDGSLASWVEHEAGPALAHTLSTHPRFKAEPIRLAIMRDEQVALGGDALSISVRDRLHARLLDSPGLSVAVHDPVADCATPAQGYLLGVELTRAAGQPARVRIRLYDAVEHAWVSATAQRWQGRLSAAEARLAARNVVPETVRGTRVLPFAAAQSDLLAAHLAASLACELRRQGHDEQVVQPARHRGAALVAGNLAARQEIAVASAGAYRLDTRVHEVDRGLYQVWAILTPVDTAQGLRSVAADAYASAPLLRRPQESAATDKPVRAAVPATAPPTASPGASRPLVAQAAVLGPVRDRDCTRNTYGFRGAGGGNRARVAQHECFAVEFDADPTAKIFIVGRETDGGFVRVHPSSCVPGGLGTGHRASHRFPTRGAIPWDSRGGEETFFIIGARGRTAVRQVEALLEGLRPACRSNHRAGSAQDFVTRLDALVTRMGAAVGYATVTAYHEDGFLARRGNR